MLKVDFKKDIEKLQSELTDIQQKQLPFAAAKALTLTVKKAKDLAAIEMDYSFKTVSRYTKNALYIKPARKADFLKNTMHSRLWLIGDDGKRRRHYLRVNIEKGDRDLGGFERLLKQRGILPSGMKAIQTKYLRLYTNGKPATKGLYQKMLSQLGAQNDIWQNSTSSTKSVNNRKAVAFFLNLKGKPAGIWMRVQSGGKGMGKRAVGKKGYVVPAWIFVNSTDYKKRYAFYEVGIKVMNKYWPNAIDNALTDALSSVK